MGKSCLLNRVRGEGFEEDQEATIEAEDRDLRVKLDEEFVKLSICDTAGQKNSELVTSDCFNGANVVFLCFDLTREATLNSLPGLLSTAKERASKEAVVYLIGCKADKAD